MSEWSVIADKIEIFPHPNADKMELGRVGTFQVVVGKGIYKTGDIVIFAPKRSILPPELREYYRNEDTGTSYLRGPNSDRVGSIRLRGQESEGVILPKEWVLIAHPGWSTSVPMGVDLAAALGIEEYIPEIHSGSNQRRFQDGSVVQKVDDAVDMKKFVRHDVESFRIFQNEFTPGEQVLVTEKIHGSQISVVKDRFGAVAVTSKGRAEKNLVLRKYPVRKLWSGLTFWKKLKNLFGRAFSKYTREVNEYWKIAIDSGLISFVNREEFSGKEVQVVGEVIPFQTGYTYGLDKRTVKVFRLVVETQEMPYGSWSRDGLSWVPVLYQGPYDLDKILPLAEGKETVSGNSLHIKEGVVLSPVPLRKAKDNRTWLLVKILNSKFKIDESGDEVR